MACDNESLAENFLTFCFAETHMMCNCENRDQVDEISELFAEIAERFMGIIQSIQQTAEVVGIELEQQRRNMAIDGLKNYIAQFPECDQLPSLPHLDPTQKIYNKLVDRAQDLTAEGADDAAEALLQIANDCLRNVERSVIEELTQKLRRVGIRGGPQSNGGGGNCTIAVNEISKIRKPKRALRQSRRQFRRHWRGALLGLHCKMYKPLTKFNNTAMASTFALHMQVLLQHATSLESVKKISNVSDACIYNTCI